jgi:GWxTD domain-containing protein
MGKVLTAIIGIGLMLGSVSVKAQDKSGLTDELAQKPVYIDYAAFYDSTGEDLRVEVYFKIFSSTMTFEKRGDKYLASYEMDVIVNKKGKQFTGRSKGGDLFADSYKTTLSRKDFIINKMEFRLPPDNYELEGKLTDSFSGDQINVKKEMKLKRLKKRIPNISSIEFVREVEYTETNPHFFKDNMTLIPSTSRTYGFDQPLLYFYYQIYNNPDFKGDYYVVYEFTMKGKFVKSDTAMFTSGGETTSRLEEIDVGTFLPGIYTLEANVSSPGNDLEIDAESDFIIEWSALAIVLNDYETAVQQLKYIASSEEMEWLKSAPKDKRIEYWNQFWQSKDESPGTPENEIKELYYRRLRYADVNFGIFGRNGWKTDMGMVYITFGPADEIERHPFDTDSKPYQIWYYYDEKLRFLFVDYNGYGEYELQYPYDGDLRNIR